MLAFHDITYLGDPLKESHTIPDTNLPQVLNLEAM